MGVHIFLNHRDSILSPLQKLNNNNNGCLNMLRLYATLFFLLATSLPSFAQLTQNITIGNAKALALANEDYDGYAVYKNRQERLLKQIESK